MLMGEKNKHNYKYNTFILYAQIVKNKIGTNGRLLLLSNSVGFKNYIIYSLFIYIQYYNILN